jgi:hypothetical protein
VVAHIYNPITQEAKKGELQVPGYIAGPYLKKQKRLNYINLQLKKIIHKTKAVYSKLFPF